MIVGVDHVVIVVRALERASRVYRALGFSVQPGGVHGDGASHNALVGFADGSYLELFAFLDTTAPRHPAWLATLERGGGISDLCLRTDDLAAEVRRLQAAGLPYPDPIPMSRRRPDGRLVAWRLSVPARSARSWLPFLIEDDTPREWRVPTGDAATHPNGATGIARIDIEGTDRTTLINTLARALDAPPHWRREPARAQFTVGSTLLECAIVDVAGHVAGPVRVWFRRHDDADRQEHRVENARLVL
jgi:catechol 2,3-dioxygenase-like lactoylglutathione lyase family enzyme